MSDAAGGDDEIVADTLFGGRLILNQFRRGHRAGTDAVLLAAAAGIEPGERFVDVGAGSGAVGLALALREAQAHGVLLEADPGSAALAARNVDANALQGRVSVACVDLFDRAACRAAGLAGSASLVVTNPPFFLAAEVRPSPDSARAAAHVLRRGGGGHGDWIGHAVALLGPRGRIAAIHRPDALPALLAALDNRLGGIVLRAVHAKADGPAIRILVGARLGTKAPLSLLPPLVLHDRDGRFTTETDALHQGGPMAFFTK